MKKIEILGIIALSGMLIAARPSNDVRDASKTATETRPRSFQECSLVPEEDIFIPVPEEKADEPKNIDEQSNSSLVSLGTYRISAYCPCEKCCGKTDGITASGTKATAGRTVAMNDVPFGTKIVIDGHEYIVEDTGGFKSKLVDVFFDTHEEALNSGLWVMKEVFMVVE